MARETKYQPAVELGPWEPGPDGKMRLRTVRLARPADDIPFLDDDKPPNGETHAAIPPEFSEDRLALRFTERHGIDLRYVSEWGKWLRWTGTHWEVENTLAVFDMARNISREAAASCNLATAKALAKAAIWAAIERGAKADRTHAAVPKQWDADTQLLGSPGGTVDLRTGVMRDARRGDYITKVTAATPGGDCPLWHEFLRTVANGDIELAAYLQRLAGYSLTGETREHSLDFFYGSGGNGKGVFLNTLTGILGDYAKIVVIETFTESHTEQHTTNLAMLRGARLVVAQETEAGRRWAESKIKAITGGDPITARFMRQDNFTFTPQFKLIIAGNNKSGLRQVDEAMRRRLHMVPFRVTIPEKKRDRELKDKLKAEWGGILQWAIEGCLQWQKSGLAPPDAVKAATEQYFANEDATRQWIEERCQTGPQCAGSAKHLFVSWSAWATASGTFVGSRKALGQRLENLGYEPRHTRSGGEWIGLKANPPEQSEFM